MNRRAAALAFLAAFDKHRDVFEAELGKDFAPSLEALSTAAALPEFDTRTIIETKKEDPS